MNNSLIFVCMRPAFSAVKYSALVAALLIMAACSSNSDGNKNNSKTDNASTSSSNQSISSSMTVSSSSAVSSSSQAQSSDANNSGTLTGVAAIGAPIVGAEISAKCSDGSGFTSTVTTSEDGSYSGEVGIGLWPCALQLTYPGTDLKLHSIAYQSGTANISPITDMALSYLYSTMPAQWYEGDIATIGKDAFNQGMTSFLDALEEANYLLPNYFDPITTAFTIGDSADKLIADVMAGFGADQSLGSYDEWLTLLKDGNLAAIPPSTTYNPNNWIKFTLGEKDYEFPLEAGVGVLGVSFSVVEQEAGADGIWTQVYIYITDYQGPGTYPFNSVDTIIVDDQLVSESQRRMMRCAFQADQGTSGQFVITQANGILSASFEGTLHCANAFDFSQATEFYGTREISGTFQYEYAGN